MAGSQGAGLLNLFPIVIIFVIFYFIIIRPQQKKETEHKKTVLNLNKNDEVVTIGGIHATIVAVKEKTYVLRIDENVKIEIDKLAVARITKLQSQGAGENA